ncbi:molybdate transport system ATP-binding protein [Microbacterium endophyticum]|uniref:Molybdate transport system ATP-binding protein n=2 Tax=Microbacterium endophyticum TaxID=1526412 RepID=A0A7W4V485_9MICO|nr:ABC transporter ATP-binding protein [Microbacterium endophyticum]MBB2975244.1 molybdate transport system ATP-binding protein [Microbacterium endophyticum]MBB2976573.1 molybdate transport system ATP-binding protein [Microbacterium endophyticum]NIK37544.1 molybdate transport system ATP-binding protein [Microbacterium endophyticum]
MTLGEGTASALDADVQILRGSGFNLHAHVALEPGEIVAVMGPSGAGKSTLLSGIAGLEPLSHGAVRIDGREISSPQRIAPAHRRGVVLLGQDPRLFPHLSASANVEFGMRAQGVSKVDARAGALRWLGKVGIAELADRAPAQLSGGQQQRVALARALAARPGVVLLDEPFTALDPETAAGLREIVQAQVHSTALIVTHDAVDALAIASRLVVIEDGVVSQTGRVREVFASPATRFVASLAGRNRLTEGIGGSYLDQIAIFRPSDVQILQQPHPGSWRARVSRIEQTLVGVRLHTESPPVAVDIELEDLAERAIAVGTVLELWVDPQRVRTLPNT